MSESKSIRATRCILARKVPGHVTTIIKGVQGSVSGGFMRALSIKSARLLLASQIRSLDPFQRVLPRITETGNIPIWRVGEIIALGVNGAGKKPNVIT